MTMQDVLFVCQCTPYGLFKVTPDRNEAVRWWNSNIDSTGVRQIKRVRWNMLSNAKGFEQDKEDNVVEFSLDKNVGGKEPPKDEDWLSLMADNTCFLASPKNWKDVTLRVYYVIRKEIGAVQLMNNEGENEEFTWVNPEKFSDKMDLFGIFGE